LRICECEVCGEEFEPYKDDCGELEEDICRWCDVKYMEGMIEDREMLSD